MSPLSSRIAQANTELFEHGRLDAIGEFFASDYTAHLTGNATMRGHRAVRQVLSSLRTSFSDLAVEVEILVEGDRRVAWCRTLRGTHDRPFLGFPANGLQIVWRDMVVSRFLGDLIAEEWIVTDLAEQLLRSRKKPSGRR